MDIRVILVELYVDRSINVQLMRNLVVLINESMKKIEK